MNTQKLYLIITGLVALILGLCIGFAAGNSKSGHDWKKGPGGRFDPSIKSGMHMRNGMSGMNHDMKGMMMDMSVNLKGKTGDEFDKAFIDEMVVHHQGAVDMAKLVLTNSKRPEMTKLANDIVSAQTKEIEMMKGWKATWFK